MIRIPCSVFPAGAHRIGPHRFLVARPDGRYLLMQEPGAALAFPDFPADIRIALARAHTRYGWHPVVAHFGEPQAERSMRRGFLRPVPLRGTEAIAFLPSKQRLATLADFVVPDALWRSLIRLRTPSQNFDQGGYYRHPDYVESPCYVYFLPGRTGGVYGWRVRHANAAAPLARLYASQENACLAAVYHYGASLRGLIFADTLADENVREVLVRMDPKYEGPHP